MQCAQQRLRSACASTQAGQSFAVLFEDALDTWLPTECSAKTLIRLCCDTQADLRLYWAVLWEMQSCRKCCIMAHIYVHIKIFKKNKTKKNLKNHILSGHIMYS